MMLTPLGRGGPPVLGAVSSALLAGPKLWFAADAGVLDGSGNPATDGVAVATWQDQGRLAANATQATSGSRPLLRTNVLNGKPVLRFDGVDDRLAASFTALAQPNTIFVVGSYASSANAYFVDGTASGTRNAVFTQPLQIFAGLAQITSGVFSPFAAAAVTAVFNGSASALYKNGVSVAAGNPGTNGLGGISIGSRWIGTDGFLPGDIAEILVYAGAMGSDDRATIEKYLSAKYALGF
jgi:hypothetical protein